MLQVFLNIVLDEAVEEKTGGEKVRIGMVVCLLSIYRLPIQFMLHTYPYYIPYLPICLPIHIHKHTPTNKQPNPAYPSSSPPSPPRSYSKSPYVPYQLN